MDIMISISLMVDIEMIQTISKVIGIVASICTILLYCESKQKK